MRKILIASVLLIAVALATMASYKMPPTGNMTILNTGNETISSATTAQIVSFDTTVVAKGITLTTGTGSVANSRIVFATTGEYLVVVSAIMGMPGGGAHHCSLWLRQAASGGTPADVANSNTEMTAPGAVSSTMIVVPFIIQVTAVNDVAEFWIHGDASGAGTGLVAAAAGSSPTRPASPSIIVTINKISK